MAGIDAINNRSFWCQFLVVTVLNLCITSLVVGLGVFYVRTELQSIREAGIEGDQQPPHTTEPGGPTGDRSDSNTTGNSNDAPTCCRPSGGETYVRWGRTTCPYRTGTELVYAGFAASAHDEHPGGSVDFFCLPTEPDWATSFNDGLNSQSYLYGMEYKVEPFDPFSHENAEFLDRHDVPCAVCRLIDRGTQLLFPAKLGCPENWTEEYRGFLMSGNHDHAQRSKAVCVDQAPEAIPGSQNGAAAALIYIVEGRCGSLQCPPYVDGRELTCTLCSI